jgi:hypothetical protein
MIFVGLGAVHWQWHWKREPAKKFVNSQCYLVYTGQTCFLHQKSLLILRTVYGDGVLRVHLSENGAEDSKMSEPTYMVVMAAVGPTRQGWMWTQHEWCNWVWKTGLVTLRDMPVALEFIGTVQNIGAPFFFTAKLKSLNSCRGGITHFSPRLCWKILQENIWTT